MGLPEIRLAEVGCLALRLKLHFPLPPAPSSLHLSEACYTRGRLELRVRTCSIFQPTTCVTSGDKYNMSGRANLLHRLLGQADRLLVHRSNVSQGFRPRPTTHSLALKSNKKLDEVSYDEVQVIMTGESPLVNTCSTSVESRMVTRVMNFRRARCFVFRQATA